MNYFWKDNKVVYFNDLQIRQGYAKDLTPLTDKDLANHLNPPKTLDQQTSLANSECTKRINLHWDDIGQRNVAIGGIYTTAQEADCKKWIGDNRAALAAILARTDILNIDVTDDQYWPVYIK